MRYGSADLGKSNMDCTLKRIVLEHLLIDVDQFVQGV